MDRPGGATTAPNGKPRYLPRKYLAPDERVRLEVHASRWFFFVRPVVVLGVAAVAEYLVLALAAPGVPGVPMLSYRAADVTSVSGLSLGGVGSPALRAIVIATVLVAIWYVFLVWRAWASTLYVVTNNRLMKQLGFIWRDTEEIALRQVRSVDIYQRAAGASLLKWGTLQIRSLGDVRFAEGTGSFVGRLPGAIEIDPYVHPRDPLTDEQGCERWFSISDPVRVQRTIEDALEKLEEGRAVAPSFPGAPGGLGAA